ncbi:ammonium transporter [Megalodesulfovibrio paquesii]
MISWISSRMCRPAVLRAGMLGALALVAMVPALALAQDAPAEEAPAMLLQKHGDIIWTLIAAMLVMFMQAGFALVETGFTRAKNANNIILKNVMDFSLGAPLFFLVGFALMFGSNVGGGFMGLSGFALAGVNGAELDGQWTLTFWFFQCVFCATAATIVSGAIAERTNFKAYLLMTMFVSAIIYPISGHWAWGSFWLGDEAMGWLQALEVPFVDFAGSSVVHSCGGWIALAGAMLLGPRIGKYTKDGQARAIPGHNIPLAALGVFILWFGWFGFNPGSTTAANGTVGYIAMNTNLAACLGVVGALITAWARYGKPDPSMTLNGALAGLVAITAGCNDVAPAGACVIGFFAGILVVLSVEFIDKVLKIDDPVGAVSVHGVCGFFGTVMVGFFAAPGFGGDVDGLLYGGGAGLLITQLIGACSIAIWAFGGGFVVFKLADMIFGIRVSPEEELKGLDITEHGSEAYSGFQIFTVE